MNAHNDRDKARQQQRGAALITVLMISTLLLATGGALVLVTGISNRTAIDSTAEMQAYYAAETGLQNALNVLRGNVNPVASMPAGTQINFRGALTLSTSNVSGDARPSCAASDPASRCRLSGWLTYNYTPSGATAPDRVAMTASYSPLTGLAYSVEVSDPDQTPIANGEPSRLLLRVIGYGPKGAEKHLELIVKRTNFDYSAPAMLLMRGSDNGTPINFDIGNSNAKEYSGHDNASTEIVPTFGATGDSDRDLEIAEDGKETVDSPKAATITNPDLPPWLRSADEARAFLAEQKITAITEGRYFTSFSGYSGSSTVSAFTFVDGDCNLDGGSGLLIVTGNLTMNGNPNFKGLILVLGTGNILRDGGGNGEIYGAVTVARFNNTGGFLAPTFNTNGGGNSLMKYDSAAIRKALNAMGLRIQGVHEY